MQTTQFDKMWNNKYLWTSLFEAVYIALYITVLGFISIGAICLIPCPTNITPSDWYYFEMFISIAISVAIFFIAGLRFLDTVFDLANFTFFVFKSKNWKNKWNLLNQR